MVVVIRYKFYKTYATLRAHGDDGGDGEGMGG